MNPMELTFFEESRRLAHIQQHEAGQTLDV